MLTDDQRRLLVDVARRAVIQKVNGVEPPRPLHPPRTDPAAPPPEASGVFVTLKARGALRGCLGTFDCDGQVEQAVARCAADAASVDPRFDAVSALELPEITIEVSLLGPLELIDPFDASAIEIGRHGLVVEDGRYRGLLLPQVAVEWNWTPEVFLRQTCIKAGLEGDAWRRGAIVYRFQADVFGH